MKQVSKIITFIFGGLMTIPFLYAAPKVKVGDMAPDFALKDDQGNVRTLSEFKGKKIALYFYPKDETPGCTEQACSIRDGFKVLQEKGIVVLGVSFDSVESHKKFKEKHNLPFPLLSDSTKDVAKSYGAVGWFIFYAPMASRMTFLIDEQGKIIKILDKVNVSEHADEIIKAFENPSA
jgi:peroxiredoxin Q/BCP